MYSEEESQVAVIQAIFIWEATNEFVQNDMTLDFTTLKNTQQNLFNNILKCLFENGDKALCSTEYKAVNKILDYTYFDVCFSCLNYALNDYRTAAIDDDTYVQKNTCSSFKNKLTKIMDLIPDSLSTITRKLNRDEFEKHVFLLLAYTKYKDYGTAMQELVSMLDIQVLRRSIISNYAESQEQ